MDRSQDHSLIPSLATLRQHLLGIARAGIDASSGGKLVARALEGPSVAEFVAGGRVTLVAAGKAAGSMARGFVRAAGAELHAGLVAAAREIAPLPSALECFAAGHPDPTPGSLAAGRRALELARTCGPGDRLVVLLSGGASALLCVPVDAVDLAAKIAATQALLAAGMDIGATNCVRKHLSGIKGGWLAVASRAPVLTLAISDVVSPVEDDLSVIGSGPTVGDPTTFGQALAIASAEGVAGKFPRAARAVLERGARGELPETPKPSDGRLARSRALVIGSRRDALDGARRKAESLGYAISVIDRPVIGDARVAAARYLDDAIARARELPRPACILAAGETTVRVTGRGRGGRNQEFALALAERLAAHRKPAVVASLGTDGVDGPTDAAGALVDPGSVDRAREAGCESPAAYLAENDAHTFFSRLDDLIRTGPTDTNVGDLQIALFG